MTASAQCARAGGATSSDPSETAHVVIPFEFEGRVGEVIDMPIGAPYPGVSSSMRFEIVKQD